MEAGLMKEFSRMHYMSIKTYTYIYIKVHDEDTNSHY